MLHNLMLTSVLLHCTVQALVLADVKADHHDDIWHHWKTAHNKVYANSSDEELRRANWEKNLATIQEHNVRHQLGLKTYMMGLNHLSDLTWEEFKAIYLIDGVLPQSMLNQEDDGVEDANGLSVQWVTAADGQGAPPDLDWREQNMVSPVKNQGHCGSCYTFSTTGAIESQFLRKYRKLQLFSEQQLVDCSQPFGNNGCYGGWQINCYNYINQNGLEPDNEYPYVAYQEHCLYNNQLASLNVTGMVRSKYGDEMALLALVGRFGPAAIAIDADQGFAWYTSGIYTSDSCSSERLTHAVLIVGYGSEAGQDYWIIKNSWGVNWGDKGYIKFRRNYGNMCGVADVASVPLI